MHMAEVFVVQTVNFEECPQVSSGQAALGALDEEIQFFLDLLKDAPDDAKLLRTLGNLYRQKGDDRQALQQYIEARRLDPTITGIDWCMAELGVPAHLLPAPLPEAVPNEIEAVGRLLQEMTHSEEPVQVDDVELAAELLGSLLTSPQPAQFVAEHLDEIDALLPALIELNIRQARADGQPELAAGLEELRQNILVELEQRDQPQGQLSALPLASPTGEPAAPKAGHRPAAPRWQTHSSPQVLILNPASQDASPRVTLAVEALNEIGCRVRFAENEELNLADKPDVILVNNPHTVPGMMRQLAIYAAANVPIIHDLDSDFEEMPANHPDYARYGLGNQDNSRAYVAGLMLARCITVPSPAMAGAISHARCPVRVIPNGWSESNSLWLKPAPRRTTLNLGWAGLPGQIEDVNLVRRLVVRIMHEFRQIQLVIAGQADVYQSFDTLPENRKLFLPAVNQEDRPYLLSQMDVIVAPLRNIPFNRAQSDQILMEAGVRQIPWVASAIPAFQEWGEGGLVAGNNDEWFSHLRSLAGSEQARIEFGQKGFQKALQREKKALGAAWLGAIQECLGSAPVLPAQPFIEA